MGRMEVNNLDETQPLPEHRESESRGEAAFSEDLSQGATLPTPVSQQNPERSDLIQTAPTPLERPDLSQTVASLPPPPVSLPPKTSGRLPSWRKWTLLGILALILIAASSAAAGYRSGINQRQRAEAAQIAGSLQSQYELALQEIEAGQYNRAKQRLEYIIKINPGYPGVTEKLAEVLLSVNSTATPTVAPTPTLTPTPDTRGVDEKFSQAQQQMANSDWSGVIDTLLNLRKADPNFQPVVIDGMLYNALRNRGRDKILKSSDLEGGIYDLTLAERFGPLDADSKSYQTWAELYLRGASFWELDWSQAVYYFAQVAPAMPNLADGSGLTATERYRQSLKGYGETFDKEEEWCDAAAQYEAALTIGTDEELQAAYDEAAQNCAGVEDEEESDAPAATESPIVIPSETAPAGATPIPTEVTPEAPPATEAPVATEAPPSTQSPVVTEPPPQEPSATPAP
jgi:hypothetical protein